MAFSKVIASLDEIRKTFELLEDWQDRYRYIIDLGKEIPGVPEPDRTPDSIVHGCQSNVWIVVRRDSATSRLSFFIDSDAHIVRGLIAIVLAVFSQRTADEILAFDIESLFDELNLMAHLSSTRGNGLRALVARIRIEAQSYL